MHINTEKNEEKPLVFKMKVSRKLQLPLLLCFLLWTHGSQSLDLVNVAGELFSNSLSRFNELIDYSLNDDGLYRGTLKSNDPDIGRRTPDLIVSRKFQVQTHSIETKCRSKKNILYPCPSVFYYVIYSFLTLLCTGHIMSRSNSLSLSLSLSFACILLGEIHSQKGDAFAM